MKQLLIWDQCSQRPLLKLIEHTASVKTITQAPRRHSLVASGGGTTYWCIHFWNTCDAEHAQLCGHQESTNIISLIFVVKTFDVIIPGLYGSFSAGLQSSIDDLQVWKYPSISKVDGLVAIDSHTR